ncbi:MAG: substrate-binding domain-containing protein [Bacteroidales bacterium]|nr:substrate-binding domain-containing protein [Bacteroides sp.]MCM1199137.1 substrate-binding domain-containing protein [Clostridium sp.]MCM1503252.1 substrate-binding domain-containing protein [Bacteroidales bacterium]
MARLIFMTDFSEAYARGLLLGVVRYTHDIGEAWSICRLPLAIRAKYGIQAVVDYAVQTQADAVIGQFDKSDDVSLFARNGIIAVAQDFKARFTEIVNITGQNFESGVMGAKYLINKGFQNFAYYGIHNIVWSDERYIGFRDTIIQANPGYTFSELLVQQPDTWNYDYGKISGWLLSLPKPVAIMACDDNQAYYITEVCGRISADRQDAHVRIPEDITLLGVDNDEIICQLSIPNLSSINQDVEKGGYDVAHLIDNMLHDPHYVPEDIVVPITHIVTRTSSDIFVNQDPYIAKVLRYIHENIATRLSVNELVAQVPLSRRLLESRFRKSMRTSIYDYIQSVRVDKVAQLLCEGSTVSEAAFELGFSDIKNISRIFKKIKGVSPSEYRKMKIK